MTYRAPMIFVFLSAFVGFGCNEESVEVLPAPDLSLPSAISDTTLVATSDAPGQCDDGMLGMINVDIDRVVGDVALLKQSNEIAETATLEMWLRDPADDVRIEFNGHPVTGELGAREGEWRLAYFEVPIENVSFAVEPEKDDIRRPASNVISIKSGTQDGENFSCDAFGGAAVIAAPVPLPAILLHGLVPFGHYTNWHPLWKPKLAANGVPVSRDVVLPSATIAQQALIVAREVVWAKNKFGVRRVSLIGHSNGGRVARHYARTNTDVANVSTIGSCHGGTRLFDVLTLSMIFRRKFSFLRPFYAAQPAPSFWVVFEATTWWSRVYNWLYGQNNTVNYESVAGVYTPPTTCPPSSVDPFCPLYPIWNRIVGQGDLMVSKQSAHALPWSHKKHNYSSSGADPQAAHLAMTFSQKAFNKLIGTLKTTFVRLPENGYTVEQTEEQVEGPYGDIDGEPGETEPPADPDVYGNTIASVDDLVTQGDVVIADIPVDEVTETVFLAYHSDENVTVELIEPGGFVHNQGNANPSSGVEFATGAAALMTNDAGDGRMTAFVIDQPVIGIYRLKVTAGAIADVTGVDVTSAIKNPSVDIHAFVGSDQDTDYVIKPGDSFDVFVDISGGIQSNASVMVDMLKPDETLTQVVLKDNGVSPDLVAGDNRYSGRVQGTHTGQLGPHALALTADGWSAAFDRFNRQTALAITVQ